MKQIVQNLKNGKTQIIEVPSPIVKDGYVLIKTHKSLVSLGTEKMLVNFGKASYIDKARQQPEKVKQVINKIKTDGLKPTLNAIFKKLNEPLPLGYCNVGEVIGIGLGVDEFKIGDMVVSNGNHAEVVNVPMNLVSKIPDNVDLEEASFTVVGAIGLQGVRLIKPNLGETIVVLGLGLIGLITTQLLRANGCKVIGVDYDSKKIKLAESWGTICFNANNVNLVEKIISNNDGNGVDGVLITASSKSDELISNSAKMCRKLGKVVLVGVAGLNLNRSDFYEKEISFQVSCSYGPGRYDSNFEEKGLDYPFGYVRWTEKRNFDAILKLISNKDLSLKKLITQKVELEEYLKIYENLDDKNAIASVISYNNSIKNVIKNKVKLSVKNYENSNAVLGIIGSGNFTSLTVLPSLLKSNAKIKSIVSANGLSGTVLANKFNIPNSITNYLDVVNDKEIDAIIITTRHDLHSDYVIDGISNNKHVFVEKPLAITKNEISKIEKFYKKSNRSITVGFNRRFSPHSDFVKKYLGENPGSINVIATINAGNIPESHWVHDMKIGGGRIIGEACHFIDLISFFTNDFVKEVLMSSNGNSIKENTDNVTIILKYFNGSLGVINYFSNGNKSYPKEKFEIFQNGNIITIDNFKTTKIYGNKKSSKKSVSQDKGHDNQFKTWLNFIKSGGKPPITYESIINTSKAAISCIESLKSKSWIDVK